MGSGRPQLRVGLEAARSTVGGGAGWASHLFSLSDADPASPALQGRAPRAHTLVGMMKTPPQEASFSSGPDAASGPGLPHHHHPTSVQGDPAHPPLHRPHFTWGPSALIPSCCLPWTPIWHLRQLAPGAHVDLLCSPPPHFSWEPLTMPTTNWGTLTAWPSLSSSPSSPIQRLSL